MPAFVQTFGLFVLAALCELGGAYLIWRWQRADQPPLVALLGVIALFVYGWIQTRQAFDFARTFAAYGGIFILTALLWGWWIDGREPDRFDWLGAGVCIAGAAVILWAPRGN